MKVQFLFHFAILSNYFAFCQQDQGSEFFIEMYSSLSEIHMDTIGNDDLIRGNLKSIYVSFETTYQKRATDTNIRRILARINGSDKAICLVNLMLYFSFKRDIQYGCRYWAEVREILRTIEDLPKSRFRAVNQYYKRKYDFEPLPEFQYLMKNSDYMEELPCP